MDMIAAMRDTLALAKDRNYDISVGYFGFRFVDYDHLASMVARTEEGHQSGTFSEAKIGRWLGYMQGVLVATGTATLDEMKEINRRHADKDGDL